MRSHLSFRKSLLLGAFAVIPGLLLGGVAIAQDATPMSSPVGPSSGYPVAIHEGTCDTLTAQPSYEISNAVAIGTDDEDDDVETVGTADAVSMVMSASATVDDKLNDLADNGNVIAVHASADDYDTIVACGNIAGVKDDGKLVVALNSVDDGTVVGVAILDEDTSGVLGLGDEQVKATVYLFDTADQ